MKLIMSSIIWGTLVLIFTACDPSFMNCIQGDGSDFKETRNFSSFEKVEVNGNYQVTLVQDSSFTMEIRGEKNLLPFISSEVRNGELEIETHDSYCLNPSSTIQIIVGVSNLDQIEVNGSGTIQSDEIVSTSIELDVDGSGTINIDSLIATDLKLDISGSGYIEADGSCVLAEYDISGSGEIEARGMIAREVEADISESGLIYCHVDSTLEGSISGSGTVYYTGEPTTDTRVSGSGSFIQL